MNLDLNASAYTSDKAQSEVISTRVPTYMAVDRADPLLIRWDTSRDMTPLLWGLFGDRQESRAVFWGW